MSRDLSTLEHTILGFFWLRGPCTTYVVMKEISGSESSYYNSRAGTAYSISKRLLEKGFLVPAGSKSLQVSQEGLAALRQWVAGPIPFADVAHSADLVRLRFFFLGSIEKSERLALIDQAIEDLNLFYSKCKKLITANEELGDYFGVLATVSTLYETQGRIAWLKFVRKWVEDSRESGNSWSAELFKQLENTKPVRVT